MKLKNHSLAKVALKCTVLGAWLALGSIISTGAGAHVEAEVSSGSLLWSQIVESRSCSVVRNEPCAGDYHMVLLSDGSFEITSPQGGLASLGRITPEELAGVNARVNHLDSRDIGNLRPECEAFSESPGRVESVDLSLRNHMTMRIFVSGTATPELVRATCYLGGKENAIGLKGALSGIFDRYQN